MAALYCVPCIPRICCGFCLGLSARIIKIIKILKILRILRINPSLFSMALGPLAVYQEVGGWYGWRNLVASSWRLFAHTPHTPTPRTGPATRRLLAQHRIEASSIEGTGRNGRVLKSDVLAFLSSRPRPLATPPATPPATPSPLPPHELLVMPALSPTMEAGKVIRWMKKEGDSVKAGDVLCEIETDKATVDFEAQESGHLATILVSEGSSGVPVGQGLAVLVEDPASIAAFAHYHPPSSTPPPSATTPTPSPITTPPTTTPSPTTPSPTTPSPTTPSPTTPSPTTQGYQTMAQRFVESKRTIPHYYLTVDLRVGKAQRMLERAGEDDISIMDYLIKAAAITLKGIPAANASWMGDFIRQYHDVHIDICTPTTSAGLSLSTLEHVDTMTLTEIAAARGSPSSSSPPHGTFAIMLPPASPLESVMDSVLPPHGCSLALGTMSQRLVLPEEKEGTIPRLLSTVTATLNCDHRVVDGAVGSEWLRLFRRIAENPSLALV